MVTYDNNGAYKQLNTKGVFMKYLLIIFSLITIVNSQTIKLAAIDRSNNIWEGVSYAYQTSFNWTRLQGLAARVAYDKNGNLLCANNDSEVWKIIGCSWQKVSFSLGYQSLRDFCIGDNYLFVATSDGVYYKNESWGWWSGITQQFNEIKAIVAHKDYSVGVMQHDGNIYNVDVRTSQSIHYGNIPLGIDITVGCIPIPREKTIYSSDLLAGAVYEHFGEPIIIPIPGTEGQTITAIDGDKTTQFTAMLVNDMPYIYSPQNPIWVAYKPNLPEFVDIAIFHSDQIIPDCMAMDGATESFNSDSLNN